MDEPVMTTVVHPRSRVGPLALPGMVSGLHTDPALMDSISLLRLAHLSGPIAALTEAGASVDRLLRRARLPRLTIDEPEMFASARLVHRFFEIAARTEGTPDLEFLLFGIEDGAPKDFVPALRLALEAYLPEGVPSVELAAEIAGTSVRTLQRRLASEGLSYSELIDGLRRDRAMALVTDKSVKLIDVAQALGFSDQAHFTRAFKRWTGMTPSTFRRELCSESLDLIGAN